MQSCVLKEAVLCGASAVFGVEVRRYFMNQAEDYSIRKEDCMII